MSARSVAAAALGEWRKKERFADAVIHDLIASESLRDSDRGFTRELFYGVLRNLILLDFWIGLLREGTLDDHSRDLLRLGLYQLFLLRTPAHAAIHETVKLARQKQRGLINAVLRTAQRQADELQTKATRQPLHVRFSHPKFIVERWQKNLGDVATKFLLGWNNRPPPFYGRINQLKIQPADFLRTYPDNRSLSNHPDMAEFVRVPSEALAAGLFYVQDPSTTAACEMLDPQPGENVLDACAAPGGKTCLLAQQMKNRGSIVACDRELGRIARLRENLDRLGVEIASVLQCDWMQNVPLLPVAEFDRILVDAPCSNTGVMRRRVDVRWRLGVDDFARMQERQLSIVRNIARFLKRGGILLYSTCSLEPEENEQVVTHLLEEFTNFRLIEQRLITPFQNGFDGAFAAKFVRES
jgi:16S rRNA (cytosine967-C5)-methyltransferase